jgi:prepilin-type processing-associated H-X9-DG protein
LEEQPLFDQYKKGGAFEGSYYPASICRSPRPDRGLGSLKNGISVPELLKTQLSVLQCPSDPDVKQLSDKQFEFVGCEVARTSYKGVLDDTFLGEADNASFENNEPGSQYRSGIYSEPSTHPLMTQYDCHRDVRCRGIFFRHTFQRPVTLAKVTDGTSKTLMIGEDVPNYNLHSTAYYSNGDWCSCNIPLNYGLNLPPDPTGAPDWWNWQGFRSLHPGGLNFCLADGSVRFVAEQADHVTFRTSCTRDGGEAVAGSL